MITKQAVFEHLIAKIDDIDTDRQVPEYNLTDAFGKKEPSLKHLFNKEEK